MTSGSPIAAALEQLQLERTNLLARINKVDAAIATLSELFHLPTLRRVKGLPAVSGNGHDVTTDAIRAALSHGPLAPRDLAVAIGLKVSTLKYRVAKLESAGVLVSTGTTAARRIALATRAPKEAP
jgi:Winged helix-turn-helix DNA-binding